MGCGLYQIRRPNPQTKPANRKPEADNANQTESRRPKAGDRLMPLINREAINEQLTGLLFFSVPVF